MYQYRATITRVVDGDTVDCDIDLGFSMVLTKQRIRLYGIDSPESRTRDKEEKKYGLLSKAFLQDSINNSGVSLIIQTYKDGRGKFGRILGQLIDSDGNCINDIMCEVGHAAPYFGKSKDDIRQIHLANRGKVDKLNNE
jgi:micrococcal nuclease